MEAEDAEDSADKEFVVLMDLREEDKDVLKCPSELEDLLFPITTKYLSLKDIKPNYSRSLLAFVFQAESEAKDLIDMTHLNTETEVLTVSCRWAKVESWNYGIIRGVLPPRSEDERTRRVQNMKTKLEARGTPVREITWLKRKIHNRETDETEVKETSSIKLEFINEIPSKVFLGVMCYDVELYTPEVTQC